MANLCKECGVPKIIARTHAWRDGCIVDKFGGSANFSIYEVSFHNGLIDEVSNQLGISIDWIVYIAGRHAAARIIKNMVSSHPLLEKV